MGTEDVTPELEAEVESALEHPGKSRLRDLVASLPRRNEEDEAIIDRIVEAVEAL